MKKDLQKAIDILKTEGFDFKFSNECLITSLDDSSPKSNGLLSFRPEEINPMAFSGYDFDSIDLSAFISFDMDCVKDFIDEIRSVEFSADNIALSYFHTIEAGTLREGEASKILDESMHLKQFMEKRLWAASNKIERQIVSASCR